MTARVGIQNRIRSLILEGPAYRVTYKQDGESVIGQQPEAVRPASVLVNEVRSAFDTDDRHGRDLITKRTQWEFLAKVTWPFEVAIDELEQHLAACPGPERFVQFPSGSSALILYRGALIQHPTTHAPSKGTEVEMSFSVFLRRA